MDSGIFMQCRLILFIYLFIFYLFIFFLGGGVEMAEGIQEEAITHEGHCCMSDLTP